MIVYFILGILFIEIAIPIVESLVSLIMAWTEVSKGRASLKISEINKEIQKLSREEDDSANNVIGFVADVDEEALN